MSHKPPPSGSGTLEDLDTSPGMDPPAGQLSHFYAPYNHLQIGLIVAFGVTYLLATVCVALRYFQAVRLVRRVEVDLVTISISYGLSAAYFATIIRLFKYGWGKHLWDVTKAQLLQLNKEILPNTLTYLICPMVTKLAILSVLYRINPSTLYRYTVIVIAALIFAYTLVLCIMIGGPCSPLKNGTLKCLEDVLLANAVLNIASDFAVVALPLPTIHNLRLPLKQRIGVGCLLALGSGVLICSISRLPYVIRLGHAYNPDSSWTQAILGTWSVIELNLGVICACLMRFKPLIRNYMPWLGLFSSRTRSRTRGLNNYGTGRRFRSGYGYGGDYGTGRGKSEYQMHSIQRANGGTDTDEFPDDLVERGDIEVRKEFKVDVQRADEGSESWYRGEGDSTDRIFD
ncbi:uncharacterized protein BDV14DRAFT_198981 [Aspergillus stella-maris]|uniref:uncharacterized protein n=1 Tax=Aspergillus stella-maris TaxID=1810926 RepID=UPI003CCCA039